jgi:hypothetical protein
MIGEPYRERSPGGGICQVVVGFTQAEQCLVEEDSDIGLELVDLIGHRSINLGTIELDLVFRLKVLVLKD